MLTDSSLRIVDGHDIELIPTVRELFREYAAWLQVDLCFQDFANELATLPGKYAPPAGAILLAYYGDDLAGCVAMRPLEPAICEMKRLWVRESFRGKCIGRDLVQSILERAYLAQYRAMRLDTLPRMQSAIALYRETGFHEIPAYYPNPVAGALYLEKPLNVLTRPAL